MGGFLSALGGAGQAASQYGQQVRNILEQNRSQMANFLTARALSEGDETRKGELLGHVADLYGGKDIAKVGHAALKTLQQHTESDTALGNAFGGAPTPPPQTPSPAGPGQTPGTATSPAAQPATSPVQPQAQQGVQSNIPQIGAVPPPSQSPVAPGPVPPVGVDQTSDITAQMGQMFPNGVPTIQAPPDIVKKWNAMRRTTPEVMWPMLQQGALKELETNQGIIQDYQKSVAALYSGLMALGTLSSPQVQSIMERFKPYGVMAPIMAASAFHIQMPPTMLSAAVGNPIKERFDAGSATPEQKAAVGLPADAKGEFTIERNRLSRQVENAYPGWVGVQQTTNAQGQRGVESTNAAIQGGGGLTAVGGGPSLAAPVVAPRLLTNSTGGQFFGNAAGAQTPPVPNAINPSFVPVTKTGQAITTVEDPNNHGHMIVEQVPTTTKTQKGGVGAVPPVGAQSPGAGAPPNGAASVPGGKVLGTAPAQTKAEWENQLTPAGQAVITEVEPRLQQIDQAMALLNKMREPDGTLSKTPLSTTLPRLGYALGMSTDYDDLIAKLELGKVANAAALLKGSSRAIQALNQAQVHLPDPKKDSVALMYDKLKSAHEYLQSMYDDVIKNEQRLPGLPRGDKPGPVSPPPGSFRTYNPATGKLE